MVFDDASIYENFKKAVTGVQGADVAVSFSETAVLALHTELVGYYLEAYTGDKFKKIFNENKRKAGDTSKVAHRPKMQLVGSSSNGQSSSGGGGPVSRKKQKIAEKEERNKAEYEKILGEALISLKAKGLDPTKLTKRAHCCAILWCCYGDYYDVKSKLPSQKFLKLKEYLSAAVATDKGKLSTTCLADTHRDPKECGSSEDEDGDDARERERTTEDDDVDMSGCMTELLNVSSSTSK